MRKNTRMQKLMGMDYVIDHILEVEGVKNINPLDPGKATLYGISSRFHPKVYHRIHTLWKRGEKKKAKIEAQLFYAKEYYYSLRCQEMPLALAFFVAGTAVNHGKKIAGKFLQRSLNAVQEHKREALDVDGKIGDKTTDAIFACKVEDIHTVFDMACDMRLRYYTGRPKRQRDEFLAGWVRRVVTLRERVRSIKGIR